jgi:threonylcarbamoyladenosine tRNA methylthiotransferase MtaB
LAQLVREIAALDSLERLRLSSIEPLEVTDEIIELVAESPKLAKHFHVPLQSGSDRMLHLMRRPYRAEAYAALVKKIRHRVPDAAIGADVMVGFPSESDQDFEQTLDLLQQHPITYLHVFPYSRRPGTPAATLQPRISEAVQQQRGWKLRVLGADKSREFRSTFLGKTLSVLTLGNAPAPGGTAAISTNYIKVELPETRVEANQMLEVKATDVTTEGLLGKLLE